MKYVKFGSLRNILNTNFKDLTWGRKINILYEIIKGLDFIHKLGLMHKDFHSGNIVNSTLSNSYITDFGLCKPITENNSEEIYGVIPFMAPEVLSKKKYIQASDIYSFGMIMLEILTSYPPYYNISHDVNLIMKICNGYKPEIKCEIPQILKDMMEECWNINPQNRPTAKNLRIQFKKFFKANNEKTKELKKQMKTVDKLNKNFILYDINKMHSEAIYQSRNISKLINPGK
jgi:serine/threonine protein kinase